MLIRSSYSYRRLVGLAVLATMGLGWYVPAAAGQITYFYDELGRLTQATYPGSVTIGYTYDTLGNRTRYVVTGSINPVPGGTPPIGQLRTTRPTVSSTTKKPSK